MVLGIDATRLATPRVGVGRYYEMLLRRWARSSLPFERVTLFTAAPLDVLEAEEVDRGFRVEVLPARGPGIWWQVSRLRRRAADVDVLLAPYTLPPGYRGRSVVSNHGILEGPDRVRGTVARARSYHFRYSASRADAVVANSAATKADLVRFYGIREDRITVIPEAIDGRFRPARGEEEREPIATAVTRVLGAPGPFFLFVGKLSTRRHPAELLRAFAQATMSRQEAARFRLLFAGPNTGEVPIGRLASELGVADRVRHVEFLDSDLLALLYRGARALLMPSEKESFSRTIAEAMTSGCPVLTLKNAQLGVLEYAGATTAHSDGGPVLEASDASPAALATGIARLAEDDELCAELRDRGLRCAARFASAEDQASRTMDLLAAVAVAGERSAGPLFARPGCPAGDGTDGGRDVAGFWDRTADRYDRAFESRGRSARLLRGRTAAVIRLLGDGPGDLLDAGMGSGRLVAELAERGWRVTGVDVSEQMVGLARRRLREASERLVVGDIEALPFPDQSFDAVVVTGVLEYVGYRGTALAEVARTLRPGGQAVISIPARVRPLRVWRQLVARSKEVVRFGRPLPPSSLSPPSAKSFARMIEGVGLTVDSVERVGASALGWVRGTQLVFAARKPVARGGYETASQPGFAVADRESFKLRDAHSYAESAEAYDRHVRRLAAPLAKHVCALARLRPGQSVLDVGTGTGIAAGPAADLVGEHGHVLGIDLSPEMIEVARRHVEGSRDGRVEFRTMDAERLELPAASVDAVVCLCAILHFPDLYAALGEMKRVTRPGGRIVVSYGSAKPFAAAPLFVHLARRALQRATFVARPSLQGPAAALSLLSEHSIAEDAEATLEWTKHRPRNRIVEAMRSLGLRDVEVEWRGNEILYTDPGEFWEAQVAISTRIRKTLESLDPARVEELRETFVSRAADVLRRGGTLKYPYGAIFIGGTAAAVREGPLQR